MSDSPSKSPGVAPGGAMELTEIGRGASETTTLSVPQDNDPSQLVDAPSECPVGDSESAPVLSVPSSSLRNISKDCIKSTCQSEHIVQIFEEPVESSGSTQQHSPAERPQDEITPANGTHNHVALEDITRPLTIRGRVAKNARQHYAALLYWLLMLCFAIFLCYYFYEVLVVVDPHVGRLNPQPSNTNFIVAVLAQVFGGLMVAAYLEILNLLHLHRLSRPGGASMLEAGQLSTNALGTARVFFTPGNHHVWTLLRYACQPDYELHDLG